MINDIYVHTSVCENAVKNENIFNIFKKDSNFTTILEHTQENFSHDFMSQIINIYPEEAKKINWNLVKENDSIGSAHIINYPELSQLIELEDYNFSPSTVAYAFKALDILYHMKKSNLNDIKILEIGAGYGGQCKMIFDMANIFSINILEYTLVDLYWPNQLQKKYLNYLGYKNKLNFVSFEELVDNKNNLPEFNYLISIYALGEFPQDIQQFYIDKMKNLEYYYIVWNTISIHNRFLLSDIEEERPRTGPYNVLIKSKVNK